MGDRRKCQTYAASPAEPGGLPVMLGTIVPIPTWLGQIGLVIVNDGGDTSYGRSSDLRLEGLSAMREVHCPHCNATNRRPKCGSCQKEIADPPGIALVWKLYRHRKVVGTASAILALTLLLWRLLGDLLLFLSGQLFGLRSARSNDAMRVLMRLCYEK